MPTTNKFLLAALSTGLAFFPHVTQAQQTSNINEASTPSYRATQQSGGAAGSEAGASSAGMFGLSTMTLAGIGAGIVAIVVVSVSSSAPVKATCENGLLLDCFGFEDSPTTTTPPQTSATTTTSSGTGN